MTASRPPALPAGAIYAPPSPGAVEAVMSEILAQPATLLNVAKIGAELELIFERMRINGRL